VNAPTTLAAAALAASLAALGGSTALAQQPAAADPPSPTSGHAQVIAQELIDVDGSGYRWALDSHEVDAAGNEFVAESGTFLLAGAQSIRVYGAEGTWARLADGEATFRQAGSTAAASTGTGASATLSTIALMPARDGGADSFVPGAGSHDVDLLRDVLASSETFTTTSSSPAFVLVTDGVVTDGDGVPIGAGASSIYTGDVSLTNSGAEPAAFVVAVTARYWRQRRRRPPPRSRLPRPRSSKARSRRQRRSRLSTPTVTD